MKWPGCSKKAKTSPSWPGRSVRTPAPGLMAGIWDISPATGWSPPSPVRRSIPKWAPSPSPSRPNMAGMCCGFADRRLQPRRDLESLRPNIVRFLTLEGIQMLLDTVRQTYPVTRSGAPAPAEIRAPEAVPPGAPETAADGEDDDAAVEDEAQPGDSPER